MAGVNLLLVALAAFGHAAFWVGVVNRWHATGVRRWIIKSVSLFFYAALAAPAVWLAWQVFRDRWPVLDPPSAWRLNPTTAYIGLCAAYGTMRLVKWIGWRWQSLGRPAAVDSHDHQVVDLADRLGSPPALGPRTRLLGLVPGNQLWRLHVVESSLVLPRLPDRLQGLSIVHWSDLHLSGRIDRGYYREVVRLTSQWPVDLIALTGDVCDSACHIDWIVELFADVRARLGKYVVLGNHDLRTRDVRRLRAALVEAGFIDLGGRSVVLDEHELVLAGDERPWFSGEPDLPPESAVPPEALRILLAHTPDQLPWARKRQFDLMLAGHTHGGQIRFPLIGPVICPSWHGTKYSCGFFDEPPTLLHVSRGTASYFPLRWRCPPEITRLVLHAPDA